MCLLPYCAFFDRPAPKWVRTKAFSVWAADFLDRPRHSHTLSLSLSLSLSLPILDFVRVPSALAKVLFGRNDLEVGDRPTSLEFVPIYRSILPHHAERAQRPDVIDVHPLIKGPSKRPLSAVVKIIPQRLDERGYTVPQIGIQVPRNVRRASGTKLVCCSGRDVVTEPSRDILLSTAPPQSILARLAVGLSFTTAPDSPKHLQGLYGPTLDALLFLLTVGHDYTPPLLSSLLFVLSRMMSSWNN